MPRLTRASDRTSQVNVAKRAIKFSLRQPPGMKAPATKVVDYTKLTPFKIGGDTNTMPVLQPPKKPKKPRL
jgi:hypothetical protein